MPKPGKLRQHLGLGPLEAVVEGPIVRGEVTAVSVCDRLVVEDRAAHRADVVAALRSERQLEHRVGGMPLEQGRARREISGRQSADPALGEDRAANRRRNRPSRA